MDWLKGRNMSGCAWYAGPLRKNEELLKELEERLYIEIIFILIYVYYYMIIIKIFLHIDCKVSAVKVN
jgi:hypothetical protein